MKVIAMLILTFTLFAFLFLQVCVSWVLLPEIEKFTSKYSDEFVKEIKTELRLESWRAVEGAASKRSYRMHYTPPSSSSSSKTSNNSNTTSNNDSNPRVLVAASLGWIVDVLQHFFGEVRVLCI
jgi:hypothetical protein